MAIHSVKNGMTSAEPEDLLFGLANFINQSGVIATGDLLVEAQATPDMTVKVAVGRAVLKTSDGRNGYPVYNDASANVTIAANSSGGTKIDAVVLYWDGAASSDANATNVAKLTTVRGTGAATPTDAEIQTAVGAGNPFLRLANVTVANGATSINSGNIADTRTYADPNIRRAVVDTAQLKANAVTATGEVLSSTANVAITSTSYVDAVTFAYTSSGGDLDVTINVGMCQISVDANFFFMGIRLDTGTDQDGVERQSTLWLPAFMRRRFTGVGSGAHTIALRAKVGSTGTVNIHGGGMFSTCNVLELKR